MCATHKRRIREMSYENLVSMLEETSLIPMKTPCFVNQSRYAWKFLFG